MGQQVDALYIRKQLEEVNHSSEIARREKKSEQRNTSKHLFKTDVVAGKAPDTSTLPQKGKYKNAYCILRNISVTNRTGLTEKCLAKSSVTKTTIEGPNIILIEPGCRIQTSNFIFKRNKNIISEDATPVLIQTEASELWKIITNNPEDEEVTELLDEMMQDTT